MDRIQNYVKLIRVHQWTKNLFCFAGLIFGGKLFLFEDIATSAFTFILFSFTASSIYVFNDIKDIEYDKAHRKKRFRPLASGRITVLEAVIIGSLLMIFSLITAYKMNYALFIILLIYILNNLFYTIVVKHIQILDVFSIAFGFVLRLLSGIYVLGDLPTSWIVLCTFFLALFLGFSKRRAEFVDSGSWSIHEMQQRPVLKRYNKEFLDTLINDSSVMSIFSYALFSALSGKNPSLIVTLPIVYYAVIHYKQNVLVYNKGEDPDIILIKDWKIWLSILIWCSLFVIIYYFEVKLFI